MFRRLRKWGGSVPCKLNNERTKHQTCTKVQESLEPGVQSITRETGKSFRSYGNSSINEISSAETPC